MCDFNVPIIHRYIRQRIIGYQLGEFGQAVASILECECVTDEGDKTLWERVPIVEEGPIPPAAMLSYPPRVDLSHIGPWV